VLKSLQSTRNDLAITSKISTNKVKATCRFYDSPFYMSDFLENTDLTLYKDINMDNIVNYLTKGRGEWKRQPSTNLPLLFNQAIMFPIAKMWMPFLCTRISLALNVSTV
ncbi:hypothetical protein Goshw_012885, partial [Gossypium schwendimanii]|nr:hypothetical protein [Gossypium schwendimanii]